MVAATVHQGIPGRQCFPERRRARATISIAATGTSAKDRDQV